jgi:hypothetical protein
MPKRLLFAFFAIAAVGFAPRDARAGKYDLDLTSLGSVNNDGSVTPDRQSFRSLSSELAGVIAPKPVDPADSLGLSGFAIGADISLNTISSDQTYWTETANGPDSVVPTLQVMGRKGLWPGLEIGAGTTKVFDSKMWTASGYGKLALHEGFHHLPIPSIAVRGMFSRLLGSKDIKVTTASVGVAISHVFGIGNTVNITPYIGYHALMAWARTGVLDATPRTDEYLGTDETCPNMDPACTVAGEFVLEEQFLVRHRPYVGFRLIFAVLRVGLEGMWTTPGGSSETIEGVDVTDEAGFQQHYTATVGFDF